MTESWSAERVAQVLRILIDNALVHTPPGTDVVVAASQVDGHVSLAVRDSGPGIRDGEDGALLRSHDALAGTHGALLHHADDRVGVDDLEVAGRHHLADAADHLAEDDAGVAAGRHQGSSREGGRLDRQRHHTEGPRALLLAAGGVEGLVEREVHVGAGVAVGDGVDVERVDLGPSRGEGRSGHDDPPTD